MIVLKRYTPDLYETIKTWWERQSAPVIPEAYLPDYGLVAFTGDRPIAAAWMIRTDSKFALIEWGVVDPNYREKNIREKAIDCVVNAIRAAAGQLGYQTLHTSTNNARLLKRYDDAGYRKSGENMTNYTIEVI